MKQRDKRNKTHYFNLQDVSNKQLFITWPHGLNANTEMIRARTPNYFQA
jgi:hypothetical protein